MEYTKRKGATAPFKPHMNSDVDLPPEEVQRRRLVNSAPVRSAMQLLGSGPSQALMIPNPDSFVVSRSAPDPADFGPHENRMSYVRPLNPGISFVERAQAEPMTTQVPFEQVPDAVKYIFAGADPRTAGLESHVNRIASRTGRLAYPTPPDANPQVNGPGVSEMVRRMTPGRIQWPGTPEERVMNYLTTGGGPQWRPSLPGRNH